MTGALIALVVLVGGVWALRKAARMSPKDTRRFAQQLAGMAALGFSGLLVLRGNMTLALPIFAAGSGLLGWSALLQQVRPQATQQPPLPRPTMARQEALEILGLGPDATVEDVKAAHRRLMKDFHPDAGGSTYLATKINLAKDVLTLQL